MEVFTLQGSAVLMARQKMRSVSRSGDAHDENEHGKRLALTSLDELLRVRSVFLDGLRVFGFRLLFWIVVPMLVKRQFATSGALRLQPPVGTPRADAPCPEGVPRSAATRTPSGLLLPDGTRTSGNKSGAHSCWQLLWNRLLSRRLSHTPLSQ